MGDRVRVYLFHLAFDPKQRPRGDQASPETGTSRRGQCLPLKLRGLRCAGSARNVVSIIWSSRSSEMVGLRPESNNPGLVPDSTFAILHRLSLSHTTPSPPVRLSTSPPHSNPSCQPPSRLSLRSPLRVWPRRVSPLRLPPARTRPRRLRSTADWQRPGSSQSGSMDW